VSPSRESRSWLSGAGTGAGAVWIAVSLGLSPGCFAKADRGPVDPAAGPAADAARTGEPIPTSTDRVDSEPARASAEELGLDRAPANPKQVQVFAPGPRFDLEPVRSEVLDGGLIVQDYALGQGLACAVGSRVTVHYVGMLRDGTVFDDSRERAQPMAFKVGIGRMIEGWERGLIGAQSGTLRKLTIPPELGYGVRSMASIPPSSTLIFEIEVVSVEPPEEIDFEDPVLRSP